MAMKNTGSDTIVGEETENKQLKAYKAIKEMILSGALPEDQFVVERKLSDAIGLSRTPVRAALSELCIEGLIVNYPGRGMVVSAVSIEDVVEIYQIRTVLDRLAFKEILTERKPAILESMHFHTTEMKKHIERGEYDKCMVHDMAFHDCYYMNTHNQRLSKMLMSLRDQIRRFLNYTVNDIERTSMTYVEHAHIIDAVDNGSAEEACDRLVEHLLKARDYHLNRIHKLEL